MRCDWSAPRVRSPSRCCREGVLVALADVLGSTLIAPAQVPAGLMVPLIGAPYLVWLLWRSRV